MYIVGIVCFSEMNCAYKGRYTCLVPLHACGLVPRMQTYHKANKVDGLDLEP
jgi:hypothetical protein